MPQKLRYHTAALALLRKPPAYSQACSRLIDRSETEFGLSIPESIREWFSHTDAHKHIAGCDTATPLAELGKSFEDWYGDGTRDFIKDGLLHLMTENQGVCNWVTRLDTEDPEVLIEVDTAPSEHWLHHADSFSQFIYCRIWDAAPEQKYALGAQDQPLCADDLSSIQQSFTELYRTYNWPGRTNYRFTSEHGSILIWDDEEGQADWFIASKTSNSLRELLRTVWNCGTLSTTLYAMQGKAAESVLDELRGARQPKNA